MTAPAEWSAHSSLGFDWRLWGDDAVVYLHASATTIALSPSASAVLATLLEQTGPMGRDELLARLCSGDGPDDQAEVTATEAQWLEKVLVELEGLGIAQRHLP